MIVAHRGASKDAPENTIPAFELAWKQGADAIEADFHLTRDGHIVCIHDSGTERISKTKLIVSKSTLSEVKALEIDLQYEKKISGLKIPTIEEVFATVPNDKSIYIEIKCGKEIVPQLLEIIKKSDLREEQIVFICFNKEVLKILKTSAPQYKVSWLCSFSKDEDGEAFPCLETVLKTLQFIGSDALSSDISIPLSFINAVVGKGFEWHVWTVDNPETAKRMKDLGAKSITTNMPKHIKSLLI